MSDSLSSDNQKVKCPLCHEPNGRVVNLITNQEDTVPLLEYLPTSGNIVSATCRLSAVACPDCGFVTPYAGPEIVQKVFDEWDGIQDKDRIPPPL